MVYARITGEYIIDRPGRSDRIAERIPTANLGFA